MSATDPIIGKKLGDYIIVDILGQGGMARVYRGIDKKLNRYAAVKVIDAHLIQEDQEEYRQRFQNEARAIARLSHPNIVGIYQFDQVGTVYYMAMSFIEGKDLRTVLKNHSKNGTRISYGQILQIINDMSSALDYAHSEGVIHRDIKPSNIMVTNSGKAILTDFGLALSVPEGTIGNTFGSAHYIAPEQAVSSAQAVPQSDIYSLGVVLFELLTNRVPFNDPSAMAVAMKHLNEAPPPPSRVNPNITPKVDQVVLKALDKDAQKRFPTATALAQALKAAFDGLENEIGLSDSQIKPLPSWRDEASSPSRPSSSLRPDATGARKDLLDSWDTNEKTATPRIVMLDDSPTVTDSKAPAATRAQLMKDVPHSSSRRLWLIGGAALILMMGLFAVVAIITNGNNVVQTAALTATAGQVEVAALLPSATAHSNTASIASPVPALTGDSTVLPSAITPTSTTVGNTAAVTNVTAVPSPIVVPTIPSPTAVSNSDPATDPVSATRVQIDPNAPVILRYDEKSLVLLNRSNENVDVSNLVFVQTDGQSEILNFESVRWNQGTSPASSLPANYCFQVMRDDLPRVDKPNDCTKLPAWSRVSFPHWFWISSDPTAVFEVKRDNQVLVTCSISAGECGFDPGA